MKLTKSHEFLKSNRPWISGDFILIDPFTTVSDSHLYSQFICFLFSLCWLINTCWTWGLVVFLYYTGKDASGEHRRVCQWLLSSVHVSRSWCFLSTLISLLDFPILFPLLLHRNHLISCCSSKTVNTFLPLYLRFAGTERRFSLCVLIMIWPSLWCQQQLSFIASNVFNPTQQNKRRRASLSWFVGLKTREKINRQKMTMQQTVTVTATGVLVIYATGGKKKLKELY